MPAKCSNHFLKKTDIFNNITMAKISKRLEELVNKMLDGQLSEKEILELDELVSAGEEAKTYLERMQKLHSSLGEVAGEKRNIDISSEVMMSVDRIPPLAGTVKVLKSYNMHLVRYAAFLIMGLLIGSVLTFVVLSDITEIDRGHARATFSGKEGKSFFYSGADWMLHFNPYITDNNINLFMICRSEDSIQIRLKINPQAYKIETASCIGCSSTPRTDVFNGLVDMEVSGEIVYKVLLKDMSAMMTPLVFELRRSGELLHHGEIIIR